MVQQVPDSTAVNKWLYDRLQVSPQAIAHFCQRWGIAELACFGSVLRTDFRPDSDVDILVVYGSKDHQPLDTAQAQQELERLLGRTVDWTEKHLLQNPFNRAEILKSYQVVYPVQDTDILSIQVANPTVQNTIRNHAALWDMVQAIQEIQEDTATIASLERYLENRLVRRAVERNLEIIGEAARRVTEEFQVAHAEVDWSGVIGLRNVVAHQYDRVDDERIWGIITTNLPTQLEQLKGLLPPPPAG